MTSASDIVVTGIGLTTSLGLTASATWQKLRAGESAIALRQPFLDLAPGPLAMVGKAPVAVGGLAEQLVVAAWGDGGLGAREQGSKDCGVVIGSSRSNLQAWGGDGRSAAAIAWTGIGRLAGSVAKWASAGGGQVGGLWGAGVGADGGLCDGGFGRSLRLQT